MGRPFLCSCYNEIYVIVMSYMSYILQAFRNKIKSDINFLKTKINFVFIQNE